jgi:hypothetical protein
VDTNVRLPNIDIEERNRVPARPPAGTGTEGSPWQQRRTFVPAGLLRRYEVA